MTDDQLIESLRARTYPGDCEAAAFRIEELLARVAELEAERDALAAELQKAKVDRDIWAAEHERQIEEKRALAAELKALREQEPVAGQCRFDGESEWKSCTVAHHLHVQAHPKEWPHYETRALYARPAPRPDTADMVNKAFQDGINSGYAQAMMEEIARSRQVDALAPNQPTEEQSRCGSAAGAGG